MDAAIAVLAKQPRAGQSKTRLCPPFTLDEAAELAEAMLQDVLKAVESCGFSRKILVLQGEPGTWVPSGFSVIPQRGANHAERISAAFEDSVAPTLMIGMDTPQVTPKLLEEAGATLLAPGIDAVLGRAKDGGWWAAGLKRNAPDAFHQVPMSSPQTYLRQKARFERIGFRTKLLPTLADVDDASSAQDVAAEAPDTQFARQLARLSVHHGTRQKR